MSKSLGRSFGFQYFDKKIREIWNPRGNLSIIDLGRDFFIAKFEDEQDFFKILSRGPWFVNSHFLTVRLWKP